METLKIHYKHHKEITNDFETSYYNDLTTQDDIYIASVHSDCPEELSRRLKLFANSEDMYQFVKEIKEALRDKAVLSIHENGVKLACENIIRKVEGDSVIK